MQPSADLVVAERFRLTRLLGRGGMGSVWLAQHLGLDIPCAVKFIEGEYAALPEAQARFEREAKAAAALRSPHVVQILDHGIWQGTPYMAMELLDGEDLGKRLQRVGRMPPHEVSMVLTQVARALTKAHAAGVVHRDLKPDNIFLVKDDDREIVKVLDFGIAKQAGHTIDGSATKTGAMLGTPYYMSPEQAQGTKAVDHRSDLWSLAVIVYQLLTGRLPFESEALGDLLVKIIVSPIPVPSQVAPDLPLAFDRWWGKAANRDPNLRYQSAKEMSDGLNLAFGNSSATDVMDRGEIMAAMARHGKGATLPVNAPGAAAALAASPAPYGNSPAPYGASPAPYAHSPAPYGASPAPYMTPQPGGLPLQATPQPGQLGANLTTGAPMARTFPGEAVPAPPKKNAVLFAVLGGVGVLAVVGIVVAVTLSGGKHDAAAAGGASAVTAVTPPAASSVALVEPPPVPAPSKSVAATPAPAPVRVAPKVHGGAASPGAPSKPAPAKPTKKPAEVDLGI